MEVAIIGLGAVSVSIAEYQSLNVLKEYTDLLIPLKNVFQKPALTATDYDLVISQINLLKMLAKDGVDDTNGKETFKSFMNEDMAIKLNDIMRTLSVVGIPPDANAPPLSPLEKVETLLAWRSLPQFSIDVLGMLNKALAILPNAYQYTVDVVNPGTGLITQLNVQASPERTLQSMLQLEYVGVGNAQMAGKMGYLEEALKISQDVLVLLGGVQNIANQIQVNNRIPPFALPTVTEELREDVLAYRKAYKEAASAYFKQIFPSAVPVGNAAQKLLQSKQGLWTKMLELEEVSPQNGRNVAGTLANAIFSVIKDISAAFEGIVIDGNPNLNTQLFEAVKEWIIDNQDVLVSETGAQGNALAIQDRITNAIKTAENLEETQREDVRRYLFLFQEFYKSAAAMIELLEQMFSKITRGINK